MDYDYPAFKIDAANPGSEVATKMESSLAAASLLFKGVDSSYYDTLKRHTVEIYEFANANRGD